MRFTFNLHVGLQGVTPVRLVPGPGVEPGRPCGQGILSPQCLPVSPPRRSHDARGRRGVEQARRLRLALTGLRRVRRMWHERWPRGGLPRSVQRVRGGRAPALPAMHPALCDAASGRTNHLGNAEAPVSRLNAARRSAGRPGGSAPPLSTRVQVQSGRASGPPPRPGRPVPVVPSSRSSTHPSGGPPWRTPSFCAT